MSKLYCKRCRAESEGKNFAECDSKIDHARGLSIGRKCAGLESDLVFTETAKVVVKPKVIAKKSTKK